MEPRPSGRGFLTFSSNVSLAGFFSADVQKSADPFCRTLDSAVIRIVLGIVRRIRCGVRLFRRRCRRSVRLFTRRRDRFLRHRIRLSIGSFNERDARPGNRLNGFVSRRGRSRRRRGRHRGRSRGIGEYRMPSGRQIRTQLVQRKSDQYNGQHDQSRFSRLESARNKSAHRTVHQHRREQKNRADFVAESGNQGSIFSSVVSRPS